MGSYIWFIINGCRVFFQNCVLLFLKLHWGVYGKLLQAWKVKKSPSLNVYIKRLAATVHKNLCAYLEKWEQGFILYIISALLKTQGNSAPLTTLRNPEMNQKWNCSKLGNAWQWLSELKWAYTAHLVICTPTCSSELHNYRVSRGPRLSSLHPACLSLPVPCLATEVPPWNGS